MLYRAAGNDIEHLVYIGKAESTDGIHFKRVSKEPVFHRVKIRLMLVQTRIRAS